MLAGVDLVRIDGSFPSFSDDDAFILYNEGFTGVSAVARDGSHKQLIFKAGFSSRQHGALKQLDFHSACLCSGGSGGG